MRRTVHQRVMVKCHVQALDIDGTLPLPLFGMAQLMSNQAGGVDKALANLEKALDKVATTSPLWVPKYSAVCRLIRVPTCVECSDSKSCVATHSIWQPVSSAGRGVVCSGQLLQCSLDH